MSVLILLIAVFYFFGFWPTLGVGLFLFILDIAGTPKAKIPKDYDPNHGW